MKTTLKRLGNVALLGMLLFVSVTANAADKFDGSSNLLCAVFNITACVDGLACAKGEARTFDMPEFMTVDFKKESIHVEYDGGKTADSPIKNYQSTEKQLIFQGVENDHGWSVAISKKTGRMSVASVGEEVTFTMFGACKAP